MLYSIQIREYISTKLSYFTQNRSRSSQLVWSKVENTIVKLMFWTRVGVNIWIISFNIQYDLTILNLLFNLCSSTNNSFFQLQSYSTRTNSKIINWDKSNKCINHHEMISWIHETRYWLYFILSAVWFVRYLKLQLYRQWPIISN